MADEHLPGAGGFLLASPAMSSPVAFVAGATGRTGRAVVTALRHRGVTTIAHVRPESATAPARRARVEARRT